MIFYGHARPLVITGVEDAAAFWVESWIICLDLIPAETSLL